MAEQGAGQVDMVDIDTCPDPISSEAAAELANKSVRTIRRWRMDGLIQSWQHRGRVWVSSKEVLRVAGLQATGHPESPLKRRKTSVRPDDPGERTDNGRELAALSALLDQVTGERDRLLERCESLERRVAQLEASRDADVKLLTSASAAEVEWKRKVDDLVSMLTSQEAELAQAQARAKSRTSSFSAWFRR